MRPRMAVLGCFAVLILFQVLLIAAPARAAEDPYVAALVAAARSRHLSRDPAWLRFGHYRPGTFGGYKSEADGEPFFLSPDGKSDPSAELTATLHAFFQPPSRDPDVQHAICQFPARFMWLDQELHFEPARLPRVDCHAFREFAQSINADSVTLVFSAYYLNNPASSFGHTFVRINKRGRHGAEHNDLLDTGVDYSAAADTSNAFLYGFKGLFGLFPGTFHKMPYYLKVREYNDYESRDLWEYDLDLRPEEVRMFVAHLWELGSTYFAYYYLSENCSYHVLAALEAASPRLKLLEPLHWPVLPADTVKALFTNPGLVQRIHYRPSAETEFRGRLHDLSADETEALSALVANPDARLNSTLTQEQRVLVLDAALDLADSKFARELVKDEKERDEDTEDYKQRLLVRRAEEAVVSDDYTLAPPFRRMPHLAHGSRRLGLGSGYSTQSGYYQTFRLRMALHDIGDPAQGYPETAQIEFLPFTLRYYERNPRLTVEDASLVRILSLSPWDQFSKRLAWSVNVGAARLRDRGCENCLSGQIEVGGGLSASLFENGVLLYLLGDVQIAGLAPIQGGIGNLPLRVGVGPAAGLRLRFTDDFLAVAQGEWLYLPVQTPQQTFLGQASLRWQYVKNFVLGVEGMYQPSAQSVQGLSYIYF